MDCRTINYNPTFIVNQKRSEVFGGQQEDYILRAHKIIIETADKIKSCKESGGNLSALFLKIIDQLSQKRAEIAKDHKSEDAHAFGKRRDHYYPGRISFIWLHQAYKSYNRQVLHHLAKYLRKMDPNDKGTFKEKHIITETHLGRITELTIEVFNSQGVQKREYLKDHLPDYISHDFLNNIKDEQWTQEQIEEYRKKFKQFKETSPDAYRCKRLGGFFGEMMENFPSPASLQLSVDDVYNQYSDKDCYTIISNMKSLFVQMILRTNINGKKMYRMSDYMTWMYENGEWVNQKDPEHHPIKRMQERSICGIMHQDEYLIEETLQDIAQLFEKAVNWDRSSQSLQDLKDLMKHYCYVSVHNMRDVRGLAAENEWLELAIFSALDVKMERKPEHLVDLMALANPLFSDFCRAYDDATELSLL